MNTKWRGFAVAVAVITGCEQRLDTPCERLAAEARGILEDCGVTFHDYPDDLGTPCTESAIAAHECLLSCYKDASCEAILFEDEAASDALVVCTIACQASPD